MHYVYVLRSVIDKTRIYVGCTSNLKRRLTTHNSEDNKGYSSRYKPWELHCYVAFKNKSLVEEFESYLKRGSGFAFLKKRLLD